MAYEKITAGNKASGNPATVTFNCARAHPVGEAVKFSATFTHAVSQGTPYALGISFRVSSTNTYDIDKTASWSSGSVTITGTGTLSKAIAAGTSSAGVGYAYVTQAASSSQPLMATVVISSWYVEFGTRAPVTAGNPIKKTDADNVGVSATVGNNITDSDFTKDTVITATAWNNKYYP